MKCVLITPFSDVLSQKQIISSVYRCFCLLVCASQDCGPLDSEAMVMGVLDQSFDVLVLRYGVQKRIYCKVSYTFFFIHRN